MTGKVAVLALEQLSLKLGDQEYCFDLAADSNRISAILGKSGSGKSTLLNLIAGFIKPASGSLTWNHESLLSLAANQRPVTTLFQQHNLFTHLSVEQNIGLGISPDLKLNSSDRQNIEEVLVEVGMQGYEKHSSETLSGGEKQRVGLARCLLRKQPILLLDEPFSALDESTRHDMIELTSNIIKSHALCVVMVTHSKDDAERMEAKQYELLNGRLQLKQ